MLAGLDGVDYDSRVRKRTLSGHERQTVLIVDDEPSSRSLLEMVLERPGRRLVFADSLDDARSRLAELTELQVAVLDKNLPGGSGLELVAHINEVFPEAETIIITGYASVDSAIEAVKLGVFDYLTKPFDDVSRIDICVQNAIDRYLLKKERRTLYDRLAKSEERYELASRAGNDGLWDWDLTSNYIYFSPRWNAMLGLEEDASGNSLDEWFGRIHPEDLPHVRSEVAEVMRARADVFNAEYRIRHADGSYRWVMTRGVALRNKNGWAYRMAGSQSDITRRKEMEMQLLHDSLHDSLTGLPNRRLFRERLQRSLDALAGPASSVFAVLFVDLDRFKNVNDSLGHLVGDDFLVEIGKRLRQALRDDAVLARLGGDEFAILVDSLREEKEVTNIAERILADLARPISLDGFELVTSASIGIVFATADYRKPEELLRDADVAMYRAKSRGKACYQVFDRDMQHEVVRRVRMETALRRALERNQLLLHYQPIVDLASERIVGFEALARWKNPDGEWVSPADFIPVARETGLILELWNWQLRRACEDVRSLCEQSGGDVYVGVNLSPQQFARPDLVSGIREVLEDCGIRGSAIVVEITESVFIESFDEATEILRELRDLDLRISLDDFGTGYSSLSYLHRLPIDILKIDRSFVRDLGDDQDNWQMVHAITSLAHALGLKVAPEGIETQAQAEKLRHLGCDYGQGYYFSPAVSVEEAHDLLRGGAAMLSRAGRGA